MEGRHKLDAVVVVPPPAQLRDRRLRAQQRLGGELAERDDHLRRDQLQLANEERLAARDLVRLGIAVLRRPALDDVRDVDVLAPELHPLGDDLREQLAGAADERLALQVLVATGRLADEHEARARVADPEDEVLAVRSELAPPAVADERAQVLERHRVAEARAGEEIAGRRRRRGRTRRGWLGLGRRRWDAKLAELALVVDP